MYDFAVIGLGPAGATAARLLASRYSVLALDRGPAGAGMAGKPCGGLLGPDARKVLAALGLEPPPDLLVKPQSLSVKTLDLASGLVRYYRRSYLNMDRNAFRRWLVSLAGGADLAEGAAYLGAERQLPGGGFALRYRTAEGEEKTAGARFILGADGAASSVRRDFFPRRKIRSYTAVQEWFPSEKNAPAYLCVFDPALTDSYAWGLSKNGVFILGGAFPPKRAAASFGALKAKLARTGELPFPEDTPPLFREACGVLRPRPFQFCSGGGGVFLLGEAAGFISPSSLEGISYALESARRLAAVFCRGDAQARRPGKAGSGLAGTDPAAFHASYRRALWGMTLTLFSKNLKSPFMYTPLLRRLVMKSGITAIR